MANHITNIVKASKYVLNTLVVDGRVDFNSVLPCVLPHHFDGYYSAAEEMAKKKLGIEDLFFFSGSDDEEIKQESDRMVDNYRQTGYFHDMDFARKVWGTKWNAYNYDIQDQKLIFDTAWNSPLPVIRRLSEMFPDDTILFTYADEDIGHNAQTMTFINGVCADVRDLSVRECCEVKGYDYEEYIKDIEGD